MKEKIEDIKYDFEEATVGGKVWIIVKYLFLAIFILGMVAAIVGVILSGNAASMLSSLFSTDAGNGLLSAGAIMRFVVGLVVLGVLFVVLWLVSKSKK